MSYYNPNKTTTLSGSAFEPTNYPWHIYRHNPHYRPLAPFAQSRPTAPPDYPSGVPKEELERHAADAAWVERQRELYGLPGTLFDPNARRPGQLRIINPAAFDRRPKAAIALANFLSRLAVKGRELRARAIVTRQHACQHARHLVARAAFRCDRWHWQVKYAYQLKVRPLIPSFLFFLGFCLFLILFVMKLNEVYGKNHDEPKIAYAPVGNYRDWPLYI
ncbi:hypothetical protein AAE478_005916 [Parahypoxylon ruwenzoriense]